MGQLLALFGTSAGAPRRIFDWLPNLNSFMAVDYVQQFKCGTAHQMALVLAFLLQVHTGQ